MNSTALLNKFVVPTIASGLVAGLAVSALTASPVAAANNAAPAAASKAKVATAKAKPAFNGAHARYGVTRSASVRNLQRALIKKRYANKSLKKAGATGNYLKATKQSVANAQRKMGFSGKGADGIVGPTSAARLGLRWVAAKAPAVPKKAPVPVAAPVTAPAPGLKVATYPGGRAQLSGASLKNVIRNAGFTGSAICTAWGIAMRESGGYPGIMSPMNSNKTYDHGLFQINDVHRANTNFAYIYNAQHNANYAFALSNRGTNFSHWGIGTQGWAGQLKKQSPAYWQMLQDRAAAFTVQCNQI